VNELASQIVFEPGYSQIVECSHSTLDKIALMLQNLEVPVIVEGCINTINKKGNRVDVNSSKIKIFEKECDIKELGLRRAERVINYFRNKGLVTESFIPVFSQENDPLSNDPSKVKINRRCLFRMVTRNDLHLDCTRKADLIRYTSAIREYLQFDAK
jgi:hypothetical protein